MEELVPVDTLAVKLDMDSPMLDSKRKMIMI